MKKLNVGFLVLSILGMLVYCLSLKFSNAVALGIGYLWLIVPSATLLVLSLKSPDFFGTINNAFYVSIAVIGTGLYLLFDIHVLHPDPQGAIAVFMLPFVQMMEIGFLGVVFRILKKKKS